MLHLDGSQGVCKVQEGVCRIQSLSIVLLIRPVILRVALLMPLALHAQHQLMPWRRLNAVRCQRGEALSNGVHHTAPLQLHMLALFLISAQGLCTACHTAIEALES